jgi:DNA replication protein DnaC
MNNLGFESTPINNLDPDVQEALRRYVKYHKRKVANGRGLWIQGDPGTGKTAAIALIAKQLTERGHTVLVRSVPALLSDIRAIQAADDERDWIHLRDDLIALDVLGLDDLAAEVPSPWALERLYELINEREARRGAILVTTNLNADQLKRRLGRRIVSRLYGICGKPIVLEGPDHRELDAFDPLIPETV